MMSLSKSNINSPEYTLPPKDHCTGENSHYTERVITERMIVERPCPNHDHCETKPELSPEQKLREKLEQMGPIAANEEAYVWGDPHFEGGDGGKWDFQGQIGNTYNLFNDTGVNINGEFVGCAQEGKTVIGQIGAKFGSDEVVIKARPMAQVFVNGQEVKGPTQIKLEDGSWMRITGGTPTVTISNPEGYQFEITPSNPGADGELAMRVKTGEHGVFSDGRMPGGLVGETLDANKEVRSATDQQGTGALNYDPAAYVVRGGLFASPQNIINYQSPSFVDLWRMAMPGMPIPPNPPQTSPMTGQTINWGTESDDTIAKMMEQDTYRKCKASIKEKSRDTDRLVQIMLAAIASGNINLAMMLFSHVQSTSANALAKKLVGKLSELQQKKQDLVKKIEGTDDSKDLNKLNHEIGSMNDDISTLQTFIKEVIQNKNQAIEFASNFMSLEHQTTMSVIRSMR